MTKGQRDSATKCRAAVEAAEAARAVVEEQGPYPPHGDDDIEHWRVGAAYAYRLRDALDRYADAKRSTSETQRD
jgi:hypothetical protein